MKCSICKRNFSKKAFLIDHVQKVHPDAIPPNMTVEQFVYFENHGTIKGKCMCGCQRDTEWNHKTGKPYKISSDPGCRKRVRETAVKNGADGHLLAKTEHQRKMQQGRSIAGTFVFPDGGKIDYLAKNELAFLRFCANVCEFPSRMIVNSPVVFQYDDNGTIREYDPDYYLPDYNLLVEIKANNTNPAYMKDTGYKVALKDEVMKKQKDYNFIKIMDNKFGPFLEILFDIVSGKGKGEEVAPRIITESAAEDIPTHYENLYLIAIKDEHNIVRNVALSGISSLSEITYIDDDGKLQQEVVPDYDKNGNADIYRYFGDNKNVDKVLNIINSPNAQLADKYHIPLTGILHFLSEMGITPPYISENECDFIHIG